MRDQYSGKRTNFEFGLVRQLLCITQWFQKGTRMLLILQNKLERVFSCSWLLDMRFRECCACVRSRGTKNAREEAGEGGVNCVSLCLFLSCPILSLLCCKHIFSNQIYSHIMSYPSCLSLSASPYLSRCLCVASGNPWLCFGSQMSPHTFCSPVVRCYTV